MLWNSPAWDLKPREEVLKLLGALHQFISASERRNLCCKRWLFYLLAPAGFVSPVGNCFANSPISLWLDSALPSALLAALRGSLKIPDPRFLTPGCCSQMKTFRVGRGGINPGTLVENHRTFQSLFNPLQVREGNKPQSQVVVFAFSLGIFPWTSQVKALE